MNRLKGKVAVVRPISRTAGQNDTCRPDRDAGRHLGETRGFVKMLVDAESDRILGFAAFDAEESEMMAAVQTAMLGVLPYTTLRDAIFTHPTVAEGFVFLANVPARAMHHGSSSVAAA